MKEKGDSGAPPTPDGSDEPSDRGSVRWSKKIDETVRQVREAIRSLTPVEAVEILVLILWAIFVIVFFKAWG